MFVLGAIKTESIVIQRVTEELMTESEATVPRLERRLQRFVSNERIQVEEIWDHFLGQVLANWHQQPVTLILNITPFDEHAQVVYLGLMQQSRVLPLAWRVMLG